MTAVKARSRADAAEYASTTGVAGWSLFDFAIFAEPLLDVSVRKDFVREPCPSPVGSLYRVVEPGVGLDRQVVSVFQSQFRQRCRRT